MKKLSIFISILAFSMSAWAQSNCLKTVSYNFTNNFDRPMILRVMQNGSQVKSIDHIIPSRMSGTVVVCKKSEQDPFVAIADFKALKRNGSNYLFQFKPTIPSFSGTPYGQVAFSWSPNNLYIFLCPSRAYVIHRTCQIYP